MAGGKGQNNTVTVHVVSVKRWGMPPCLIGRYESEEDADFVANEYRTGTSEPIEVEVIKNSIDPAVESFIPAKKRGGGDLAQ